MSRLLRSWRWRVAVAGHSMAPTLRAGDWLLVDPDAFGRRAPAVGELVVARDPRQPARWLVKRVADIGPGGRLSLAGDHPAHAQDSDVLGTIEPGDVIGRPWLRYWPFRRIGGIR
jgi:signal peptidase I